MLIVIRVEMLTRYQRQDLQDSTAWSEDRAEIHGVSLLSHNPLWDLVESMKKADCLLWRRQVMYDGDPFEESKPRGHIQNSGGSGCTYIPGVQGGYCPIGS